MKQVWLKVARFDNKLITSALEAGIDTFVAESEIAEQIRQLARVRIAGANGDLIPGRDYHEIFVQGKEDEERAAQLGQSQPIVLTTPNWEIIPIENLIASSTRIFWVVNDVEKARLAFEIMEKGVEGVVLDSQDPAELRAIASLLLQDQTAFSLSECEIVDITPAGIGDRVCVDTATSMSPKQGMLAGNSSGGMLLVQSESSENPYVAARPFRVNLSAVHAYTPRPDGKTSYLSELKAGDKILVINDQGHTELALVGRIKQERRPMLLVTFKPTQAEKPQYSLLLQNAETVRLFQKDGSPISITQLQPGSVVLGHFDSIGRHFGMKVEESIQEK